MEREKRHCGRVYIIVSYHSLCLVTVNAVLKFEFKGTVYFTINHSDLHVICSQFILPLIIAIYMLSALFKALPLMFLLLLILVLKFGSHMC